MEVFQRVPLLASAEQLDRLAGDSTHGKCSTTAAITINPGEHNAGDADLFLEGLGGVDCVLTGEAVSNKKRFVRAG